MYKTKVVTVVEAFELGIPIIYNSSIYKMNDDYIIQQGIVRSYSNSDKIEIGYMYEIPLQFAVEIANNLNDEQQLQLLFVISQVKNKLELGATKNDLTFEYEDKFFNKLKGNEL